MQQDDPRYQAAAQRVKARTDFYRYLAIYLILSVFFWVIAIATDGGWWPVWYMIGGGIGVAFMGLNVFIPRKTEEERQRMIEEEMRRGR